MRTIGLLGAHVSDEIPSSPCDLIECPPVAALTTVMPDGYPQTSRWLAEGASGIGTVEPNDPNDFLDSDVSLIPSGTGGCG